MLTEHSVTYEGPGWERQVTREVFATRDGRILGTEHTVTRRYCGYDGWKWTAEAPVTVAFVAKAEATAWMDAMFAEYDVWKASQSGVVVAS